MGYGTSPWVGPKRIVGPTFGRGILNGNYHVLRQQKTDQDNCEGHPKPLSHSFIPNDKCKGRQKHKPKSVGGVGYQFK